MFNLKIVQTALIAKCTVEMRESLCAMKCNNFLTLNGFTFENKMKYIINFLHLRFTQQNSFIMFTENGCRKISCFPHENDGHVFNPLQMNSIKMFLSLSLKMLTVLN